jgi:hypothetical protein
MAKDIEYFFMYLSEICISSLKMKVIGLFCYFGV